MSTTTSKKRSQSAILIPASNVIATIFFASGINALLRPRSALGVFDFPLPESAQDQTLVDGLMAIYGIRDAFMGVALYAAAWYGERKALGWIQVAGGAVAVTDGIVSYNVIGRNQWMHIGYSPLLMIVGVFLTGLLD